MLIAKDLAWLSPFIDEVGHLIPLDKLIAVRGYKQQWNKQVASYGGTHMELDQSPEEQTCSITLLTHVYNKKAKRHEPEAMGLIIDTLAHELAHLVFWEHSWEHFRLQVRILQCWVDLVREQDLRLWPN